MSVSYMRAAWQCENLSGSKLILMVALANYRNDQSGKCCPSTATLAKDVRVTERQVVRLLRELEEEEYISVLKHGDGRGNTTNYHINLEKLSSEKGDICDITLKERVTSASPFDDKKDDMPDGKRVTSAPERMTFSAKKDDILGNLSIYKNQYESVIEPESEPAHARGASPLPSVGSFDEIPVPENDHGIKGVRVPKDLNQRADEIKSQLPTEIFDPPSKGELRLLAAQKRIPEEPTPSKRNRAPTIDSPHVTQRLLEGGYIAAGQGKTAVEVYGERFSLIDEKTKLSMPLQDDLVGKCPDLKKLREVVTEYSQRTYQPRNMKLIFDWYEKGVPARKENQDAVTGTSAQKPATAPGANLGKAARVGRNEAKELFKNHPIYAGAVAIGGQKVGAQ